MLITRAPGGRRLLASAVAAGLVAVALTGCSALAAVTDMTSGIDTRNFASYEDAVGNWSVAGVPAWLPPDATDIHHRATRHTAAEVIAYTSPTAPVGECVSGARTSEPRVDSTRAPETLAGDVVVCADWQIQQDGSSWYAWRSDEDPAPAPEPEPAPAG